MPTTTTTMTIEEMIDMYPQPKHLPGCPVEANPSDPGMAARIEMYEATGNRLAEALEPPDPVKITRCCQCGRANYSTGSKANGAPGSGQG